MNSFSVSWQAKLRIIRGHYNVSRYTCQLVVACQCACSRETAGSGMTFLPDLDGFTSNQKAKKRKGEKVSVHGIDIFLLESQMEAWRSREGDEEFKPVRRG